MPEHATSFVYINGQLYPAEAARVSPLGSGFLHGMGLFETMRAYQGRRLFRLDAHLDRLFASAAQLGLDIKYAPADLTRALQETLAANALGRDGYVRLTVAQGANDATDVLITAQPLTQYPDSLYQRGAYAIIAEIRRNPTSLLARIKSLNYLENLIIRKQAGAQGADEAIFLDADGCLAEGTASNLFWAESDVIYTPSLDCPILPGVTRAFVIQLAHQCGYRVEQGKWKLANLLTADEAFLTNSLMEVMPLTRLNPHLIGDRRPGQMTLTLKRLYRNEVEKQLSSESLVAYKSSQ